MNFPGCSRTRACLWWCFAVMYNHMCDRLGMRVCVCARVWTLITNQQINLKIWAAQATGCYALFSQVCLITFPVSNAMPPKLSTGYARQIFIKAAIDFNCVVNRHTPTWLSASPFFSSPSSLCINSCFPKHLQLHVPVIFLTLLHKSQSVPQSTKKEINKRADNCQCCGCCRCE